MEKVRGAISLLLLAVFCSIGVFLLVGGLVVVALFSGESWLVYELVELLGLLVVAGAALFVAVTGLALWLRPRRRLASDVLATLLGLLVVTLTARHASEYGFALAACLAGLLLVLAAFPLSDQPGRPGDGHHPLGSYR